MNLSNQQYKLKWQNYLASKYWGAWFSLGLLRLIAVLPYRLQYWLGVAIGELLYRLVPYRREVVRVNIRLCFPELSTPEQEKIVRKHFHSLGVSVSETAISWWGSEKKIRGLVKFKNLDIIEEALKKGKGAIVLGAHYTTMEISGCFITLDRKFAVSYQQFRNQLFNELTYHKRKRIFDKVFERTEIRQTYRYIKDNNLMWIASDQDKGPKNSVFAPFFGHQVATQTVPSRIAKVTGAPIIPYISRRLDHGMGYEFEFCPALENFPSDSLVEDATRVNKVIEDLIRMAPEQYLWIHRRFKTRPEGEPDLYPENRRRAKRKAEKVIRRAKQQRERELLEKLEAEKDLQNKNNG